MQGYSVGFARVFLFWLLLSSSAFAAEQGLLWQISGQGADGYLFGTMHSEDPRVLSLPPLVEQHFSGATTLMVEIALDAETEAAVASYMVLPPGQTLTGVVGKRLAAEAQQAMLERGLPPEVTERLQPWATVLTLSTPEQHSGLFLDKVLYERAQAAGKAFYPLESVEEQIGIFGDLSNAEQREMLRSVLQEYRNYPQMFERMTEAYLARDLVRLSAMSDEHPISSDPALQQRLMEQLLDERNRRMVERIEPRLRSGGLFIAVGALHLPGEGGLVALLRQRGYTVEPLY